MITAMITGGPPADHTERSINYGPRDEEISGAACALIGRPLRAEIWSQKSKLVSERIASERASHKRGSGLQGRPGSQEEVTGEKQNERITREQMASESISR